MKKKIILVLLFPVFTSHLFARTPYFSRLDEQKKSLIRYYSNLSGVNPNLVKAIIQQESEWIEDCQTLAGYPGVAESSYGLMQLTVRTAQDVCRSIGLQELPPDETIGLLLDGKSNIMLGCAHLKNLYSIFRGKKVDYYAPVITVPRSQRTLFVIAAYFLGSEAVRQAQCQAKKNGSNPASWREVKKFIKVKNAGEYVSSVTRYCLAFVREQESIVRQNLALKPADINKNNSLPE